MLRYVLTAAGALAMISGVAFAETGDMGASTTKVISKSAPAGMHNSTNAIVKERIEVIQN